MKFTRTIANVLSSAIVTWPALVATGVISDSKYAHWISVVCFGLSIFMTNMGFTRTPGGTPLPTMLQKEIDSASEVKKQMKQENPQ